MHLSDFDFDLPDALIATVTGVGYGATLAEGSGS